MLSASGSDLRHLHTTCPRCGFATRFKQFPLRCACIQDEEWRQMMAQHSHQSGVMSANADIRAEQKSSAPMHRPCPSAGPSVHRWSAHPLIPVGDDRGRRDFFSGIRFGRPSRDFYVPKSTLTTSPLTVLRPGFFRRMATIGDPSTGNLFAVSCRALLLCLTR